MTRDVPQRRRFGCVEVRHRGTAAAAFDLGPLAVWPRPAPPDVVPALLEAVDDENERVRFEAAYAMATFARPPLRPDAEQLRSRRSL